jgi:hypothetical protein
MLLECGIPQVTLKEIWIKPNRNYHIGRLIAELRQANMITRRQYNTAVKVVMMVLGADVYEKTLERTLGLKVSLVYGVPKELTTYDVENLNIRIKKSKR